MKVILDLSLKPELVLKMKELILEHADGADETHYENAFLVSDAEIKWVTWKNNNIHIINFVDHKYTYEGFRGGFASIFPSTVFFELMNYSKSNPEIVLEYNTSKPEWEFYDDSRTWNWNSKTLAEKFSLILGRDNPLDILEYPGMYIYPEIIEDKTFFMPKVRFYDLELTGMYQDEKIILWPHVAIIFAEDTDKTNRLVKDPKWKNWHVFEDNSVINVQTLETGVVS